MKNILALDYGTKTGYCYGSDVITPVAGTWKLAGTKEVTAWHKARLNRTRDPRIARLQEHLRKFPLADLVVFEDVNFSSTTYQAHLWASFRTVAWLDYPNAVRFECVPVGTLKKFATGSGTATKEMMARTLALAPSASSFDLTGLDDNAVDAIWIWLWARHNLCRN